MQGPEKSNAAATLRDVSAVVERAFDVHIPRQRRRADLGRCGRLRKMTGQALMCHNHFNKYSQGGLTLEIYMAVEKGNSIWGMFVSSVETVGRSVGWMVELIMNKFAIWEQRRPI